MRRNARSAHVIVTATNGATLLNVSPQLTGFKTYTFALPTDAYGDYQLMATATDKAGQADRVTHAYAVPLPLDTQAPAITLTVPSTTTIITSNALTMTLPIAGQVSDDRGPVTVLMAGRVITPVLDGSIATNATIKRGLNVLSLTAVDAAGNITSTPGVMVYLLALRGSALSVNRNAAQVGDVLKYQIVLTTTGAYSNVVMSLPLPTIFISNVSISASTGAASMNHFDQVMHYAGWTGDVSATQPVTITVQGTIAATGTLSTTATIH